MPATWDKTERRRSHGRSQPHNYLCAMTDEDLETFLDAIAERGANRALKKIGLEDENAYVDIKTIRGVLKNWRLILSAAWGQLGRMIMIVIVIMIAAATLKPTSELFMAIQKGAIAP